LAVSIRDWKAVYLTDTTGTIISPMQMTGGTVSILGTTSTVPVSLSTTSTYPVTFTVDTTSTRPVSFATTSTVQAVTSPSGTQDVQIVSITDTTSTRPVSFSPSSTVQIPTTSTVQAVTAVGYTSSALWSDSNVSAGDTSGVSADLSSYRDIGAFVTHSAAAIITIEVAHDTGTTAWYPDTEVSLDAGGSMAWKVFSVGRFYRFKTDTAGTVTAIISAKG